jgi:DNA-binding SARP family transcriptional activator
MRDRRVAHGDPGPGARGPHELQFQLLGGFNVRVDGRSLSRLARRSRAAELLKLLALAPRHHLHREEVLDLLWPDFDSDAATNNLHRTLHAARRTLEPALQAGRPSAFLRLDAEVLTLRAPGALWVDVEAFELACTIAETGRDPAAYEAALDLYTGDLLPADRFADWAAIRREALRARYTGLLFGLAALYEARQESGMAVHVFDRLVAVEPAYEEAHVRLMRLYALAGLRTRALRQYRLLKDSLRRELDAEPERASRHLADEIAKGRFAAAVRPVRDGPHVPTGRECAHLSAREAQVARLIAQGLTNRQIALRLGLSTRTAETHVSHILRKLGLSTRADVVVWATGAACLHS